MQVTMTGDRKAGQNEMDEKRGVGAPSIFAVIVALWVVGFGYTFCMQQSHLNEVEEDRAVAIARLEEARARNAALKEERDGLDKPEYIEKVAREELGMTRHGEMPYISAKK